MFKGVHQDLWTSWNALTRDGLQVSCAAVHAPGSVAGERRSQCPGNLRQRLTKYKHNVPLLTNIYWAPSACQLPSKSLVNRSRDRLEGLPGSGETGRRGRFHSLRSGCYRCTHFAETICLCAHVLHPIFHRHGPQSEHTHPAPGLASGEATLHATAKELKCNHPLRKCSRENFKKVIGMESRTLEDRCVRDHRTTAKELGWSAPTAADSKPRLTKVKYKRLSKYLFFQPPFLYPPLLCLGLTNNNEASQNKNYLTVRVMLEGFWLYTFISFILLH